MVIQDSPQNFDWGGGGGGGGTECLLNGQSKS